MKEKKLEAKEIKKAICTIREYCNGIENCKDCDEKIKDWCLSNVSGESPCGWKVDEDEE